MFFKKIKILQPLTEFGVESAKALGRSDLLRGADFFKIYASDLPRTRKTSQLILESASKDASSVVFDKRLRELARGAREGFPKHTSYEDAVKLRHELQMEEPLPLLETEDDGWNRSRAWLNEVIREVAEHSSTRQSTSETTKDEPYFILAIAHSGLVRVFLRRLLGDDRLYRHPEAKFEPDMNNKFKVPNTSLTILEIRPRVRRNGQVVQVPKDKPFDYVDIIQLTWTGHYTDIEQEATATR